VERVQRKAHYTPAGQFMLAAMPVILGYPDAPAAVVLRRRRSAALAAFLSLRGREDDSEPVATHANGGSGARRACADPPDGGEYRPSGERMRSRGRHRTATERPPAVRGRAGPTGGSHDRARERRAISRARARVDAAPAAARAAASPRSNTPCAASSESFFGPGRASRPEFASSVVERLYRFSESRGREAAGLAIHDGRSIPGAQEARPASVFIASDRYRKVFEAHSIHWSGASEARRSVGRADCARADRPLAPGDQRLPVQRRQQTSRVRGRSRRDHTNGIIVNDAELWTSHPGLQRKSEVDTEVLVNLLRLHFDETQNVARRRACPSRRSAARPRSRCS
jgi:hypothetical protein